ncbi:MAG TPA: hypothetical protein VE130_06860 [Nitrososphaeraceae archaeon]|jgi:DNA-binding NtrC family response regulator|nr:hypothetical protein [Nitrososphaeraceae archaeon]
MTEGNELAAARIIAVDHDPDITRLYRKALEEMRGIHVITYNDQKELYQNLNQKLSIQLVCSSKKDFAFT